MDNLPELLSELLDEAPYLRNDIALMMGLSCQERHFLRRCANSCGVPLGTYIQLMIRSGGDPLLPPRGEG